MTHRQFAVGIDFGGTNIKLGLVNRRGRVVRTAGLATERVGRPGVFVPAVARAVEELARSAGLETSRLRGVGIGAPGLIDVRRGVVHHLVNVRGWRGVPLARLLVRRLRCPCVVDNDANLVTLGEWRHGAGRGARHLVSLTLGTGVGGGLIIDNRLYRGANGSAGELGHMVIEPGGRPCACGNRGCFETTVATAAIEGAARRAMRRGSRILRRLSGGSMRALTPELVCRAARQGDRLSRHIWEHVGHWLGVGVANLVNALNPDRVVIGGGVSNAWPLLYPAMMRTLRNQAMDVPLRAATVVRGRLGAEAGIIGGAVLIWQRTGER